jgi:hypothetical protein
MARQGKTQRLRKTGKMAQSVRKERMGATL